MLVLFTHVFTQNTLLTTYSVHSQSKTRQDDTAVVSLKAFILKKRTSHAVSPTKRQWEILIQASQCPWFDRFTCLWALWSILSHRFCNLWFFRFYCTSALLVWWWGGGKNILWSSWLNLNHLIVLSFWRYDLQKFFSSLVAFRPLFLFLAAGFLNRLPWSPDPKCLASFKPDRKAEVGALP